MQISKEGNCFGAENFPHTGNYNIYLSKAGARLFTGKADLEVKDAFFSLDVQDSSWETKLAPEVWNKLQFVCCYCFVNNIRWIWLKRNITFYFQESQSSRVQIRGPVHRWTQVLRRPSPSPLEGALWGCSSALNGDRHLLPLPHSRPGQLSQHRPIPRPGVPALPAKTNLSCYWQLVGAGWGMYYFCLSRTAQLVTLSLTEWPFDFDIQRAALETWS